MPKTVAKPYASYVPKKKNTFAALEDPIDIDYCAKLKELIAADPIIVALQQGTISWADTLKDEEETPAQLEAFRVRQQACQAARELELKQARIAAIAATARTNFDAVVVQLNRRPIACAIAQAHLDDYHAAKQAWLETVDDYDCDPDDFDGDWEQHWTDTYDDWYKHATKDIHRDANGEPEVCRFFNSPGGCRLPDGKKCPYKHVAGVAPEPCKFFNSPRGCNKGAACPFTHASAAPSWRVAGGGGACGASSCNASSCSSHSRPPLPPRMECKFFKSARGCNKGDACPYKH
jgi:hypothetical protein